MEPAVEPAEQSSKKRKAPSEPQDAYLDFTTAKRKWRRNKVYMKRSGKWAYYPDPDTPLARAEFLCKTPVHPNAQAWVTCEFVDSNGSKCAELCVFAEADIAAQTFDCELYTQIRACSLHQKNAISEKHKRSQRMSQLIEERKALSKFPSGAELVTMNKSE